MWRFLVRATGLLQIVAERPLPFHFRVIRVCALILTEIVTLRACFGVSQIGDPPYNFALAIFTKNGLNARDIEWVPLGTDGNGRVGR